MEDESEMIENRVAQSSLTSIDLKDFYTVGERAVIHIKDYLTGGLILKEKEFRTQLKNEDWSKYKGKFVAIATATDAIIPAWAYMLLSAALQPFAGKVVCGGDDRLEELLFHDAITVKLRPEIYKDKRVMIKGCGDIRIPLSAFAEATALLMPYVKSIMYGEACSNVPVYKKPAN